MMGNVFPLHRPQAERLRQIIQQAQEKPAPFASAIIEDDAPMDGKTYGRMNGTWYAVVPLSGATMEGPLFLFRDPVEDMEAATKYYFDHLNVDGGEF
jgi:hypothetical protein